MHCGDFNIWIQEILGTSVKFDGYKKTPILTDFLQADTLNAENKKKYYQQYNVKGLRAFHKQAMIKQQIYDSILAGEVGWTIVKGYSLK